mmetsp:Transcript_6161/g.17551  ORF Transcript_6161/g.17551 Transcript_6161/m.17551 type:complete len:336 (+) Transcript_6161:157-1164(+)
MRLKSFIFSPLFAHTRGTTGWILGRDRSNSRLPPWQRPTSARLDDFSLSASSSSTTNTTYDTTIYNPRLVILIPAYNEEGRIELTLKSYQDFLLRSLSNDIKSEIVIVDDGSSDATLDVINNFPSEIPIYTVVMKENKGKGAAIARGVQHISQKMYESFADDDDDKDTWILTQDADGSGDLIYLENMMNKLGTLIQPATPSTSDMTSRQGLVIGNRKYDIFSSRGITRWGFQTCVRILTSNRLRVNDSQCGYKLMTLDTAKVLYENLHLEGWSHDVEVLFRAMLLNIPIDETNIEWEDMEGSKVTEAGIVKVSLQMLWDVIRLRWNYSVVRNWTL